METKQSARAVLKLSDNEDFCHALTSGDMPTAGIDHYDLRVEARELVVRGSLAGVAAVSAFLQKRGVLAGSPPNTGVLAMSPVGHYTRIESKAGTWGTWCGCGWRKEFSDLRDAQPARLNHELRASYGDRRRSDRAQG